VSGSVHIQLYHGDLEFVEGVSLVNARVAPLLDSTKCGFSITTSKGFFTFFCPTVAERDEWVKTIAIVSQNLSEETMVLRVFFSLTELYLKSNGFIFVGFTDQSNFS
jgi:hypothetical protein